MTEFFMRPIPFALVEPMWHYAEPYIKRALDHTSGEVNVDDIKRLCIERDVQLWIVSTGNRSIGAVTTEILNYPHRKHCRVITIGGSVLSEWLELCDNTLSTWATAQGCDAIEAYVRKGLVPKLAVLDWKHKHSIVAKELQHG